MRRSRGPLLPRGSSSGLAAAETHYAPFPSQAGVCGGVGGLGGYPQQRVGLAVRTPISDLCRGRLSQLAHAIRLLLEYTDSNYEEKKYAMGDGNGILLAFRLRPNSC